MSSILDNMQMIDTNAAFSLFHINNLDHMAVESADQSFKLLNGWALYVKASGGKNYFCYIDNNDKIIYMKEFFESTNNDLYNQFSNICMQWMEHPPKKGDDQKATILSNA